MPDEFGTWRVEEAPEVRAPDGSTVHPLGLLSGVGSFAEFVLAPGQASAAVTHRTVQEIWYVVAGAGEMWRRQGERAEITGLVPGVCLSIPLGTEFQFRAGADGLRAVAVTAPPWPEGTDEAVLDRGPW
jgi:mannose-6-phosphate isomerase-like protein (cupin superfamily)